jgi:hypothetical protein
MMFSTTPFTFDPATGFSGFTPYDGPATTEGIHDPSAIPDAASWTLILIGLAGVGLAIRHRKSVGPSETG